MPQPPTLTTIHSPSSHQGSSPKQYQPWDRNQHGVTEMADTKELDAIFKSPRKTIARRSSPGATTARVAAAAQPVAVVTPAKKEEEEEASPPPTTTMITNLPPNQDPEFNHHLQQSFPLDDRQYSIPSIRLANAVHRSDSLASFDGTFSGDESTWEGSYVGEDEDCDTEASWSTAGGGGSISSLRRNRFMRHLSSASLGMSSLEGMRHLNSSEGQNSSSSIPPAIAPSNSFMERLQGITINQRSNTFESSSDAQSNQGGVVSGGGGGGPSNNPDLMINATQSMDDVEFETRQDQRVVRRSNHHRHRSARRSRRSSHTRTSSAVEWIQGLQNPSNGGGVQIVEAASSKFLIGGADGGGAEGEAAAAATSEGVAKALGMPHPLCRSSTIEAGPFVNRVAAATAATNGFSGE